MICSDNYDFSVVLWSIVSFEGLISEIILKGLTINLCQFLFMTLKEFLVVRGHLHHPVPRPAVTAW